MKVTEVHFKFSVGEGIATAIHIPTGKEITLTGVTNFNLAKQELLAQLKTIL